MAKKSTKKSGKGFSAEYLKRCPQMKAAAKAGVKPQAPKTDAEQRAEARKAEAADAEVNVSGGESA